MENKLCSREKEAIGKRLELLLHELGLNKAQLAKQAGVAPSYITNITKGIKSVGADLLCYLRITHDVNVGWLVTGNGDMFEVASSQVSESSAGYSPETRHQMAKVAEVMESDNDVIKSHLCNAISAFHDAVQHDRQVAELKAAIKERDRKLKNMARNMEALKKSESPESEGLSNEEGKT